MATPFFTTERPQQSISATRTGRRDVELSGGCDKDDVDDEDISTKKHMLPPKVVKKKKIQSTSTVKQSTTSCGKQKKSATLGTNFMSRTTPSAQKSLQNCWQRKEAVERCDLALAKWMIDACVPFNAVNSVYYQHAIDVVTAMGPVIKDQTCMLFVVITWQKRLMKSRFMLRLIERFGRRLVAH